MKKVLIFLICFIAVSANLYAEEEVLTNGTIIKMVKADLGEAIIVSKIKSSKTNFDLSTDGILKLKDAGVSEKIIEAMMGKKERPAEVKMQEVTTPPASSSSEMYREGKKGYAYKKGYFSLKGGLLDPSTEYGYDTGYNGEIAIGIKVNPYFIIDIGGGYYTTEREILNVEGKGYKYEASETYSLIPITLTLKGNVPLGDGKAELYGGGGLGYYLAKREYEEKREYTSSRYTSYYPYYTTYTEKKSDSYSSDANALGYHFVIGCDFNLSKSFALGIEAKWFDVKPEFDYKIFGYTYKDIPTPMGGWIFNAGLKIRF